jgi:hypothetical protein
MTREFRNRVNERWLYVPRGDRTNSRLAIFVHGYMGGYISTWEQLPDLLRDEADNQPIFRDWDYLFLGYRTVRPGAVTTFKDIADIVVTHWRNAIQGSGPFFDREESPYKSIALVAHSLGSLGVRYLVADDLLHIPKDLFPTLKSLAFFGTPKAGSYLAYLGGLLAPISSALEPASPHLRALRDLAKRSFPAKPWPAVRIMRSHADLVVGTAIGEMVDWPGDAPDLHSTNLGHIDMCKPMSWDSEPIDFLRDVLRT